jgi:hypothetical protein
MEPSKRPVPMQHRLKFPRGAARTRVIAPEPLEQLFFAANEAVAAFHVRL